MYNNCCKMSTAEVRSPRVGRPRGFEPDQVVEAAGDLFWERGYEMTSIGELEKKTGLDRSSLYHAFGNKHALFEAALKCYVEVNLEARLVGMREGEAGLETVADFFTGMAETFRSDPRAGRGCLMVNSVAELGSRDTYMLRAAIGYRDKFREAFATALSRATGRGEVDGNRTRVRAELLTATTMGLFLTARIDLADAAETCEGIAAEVSSWRQGTLSRGLPANR